MDRDEVIAGIFLAIAFIVWWLRECRRMDQGINNLSSRFPGYTTEVRDDD